MAKKKKEVKKQPKREKIPFSVIGSPEGIVGLVSTHTRGLTGLGMPEFLIDPFAFGTEGNRDKIIAAYTYLIKPQNRHKLDDVLSGETIKLDDMELITDPDVKNPTIYCLREVTPAFQAVQEAYCPEDGGIKPNMRFIQIWVYGDDFALEDMYYKDGVYW
jgi:hypothetical protein